jgi:filamentous hemagglutinin family protein
MLASKCELKVDIKSGKAISFLCFLILGLTHNTPCTQANELITPDNTLKDELSIVDHNIQVNGENANLISGGSVRGSSLFHSFVDFNIRNGEAAYFINPTGISSIFSRITGTGNTYIGGTLGVLGNANLYLINPNGIIFGLDSKLDLNGSFLATTADSVIFRDSEFSAINPESIPVLTIDIPIGLNFNGNNGDILVLNTGAIIYQSNTSAKIPPTNLSLLPQGLGTKPGKDLSLIGKNINFDGGVINTPSDINIIAINKGTLNFETSPENIQRIKLENQNKLEYGDINLFNSSLILNQGFVQSHVNIVGENIGILEGSSIIANNIGLFEPGLLSIVAQDNLNINGNPSDTIPAGFNRIVSGILSNTFGSTDAPTINIKAKVLTINDEALISSSTFAVGNAGDIFINTNETLLLNSTPSLNSGSSINTYSAGDGDAGSININSSLLSIKQGSQITSAALDKGTAGDVNITTTNLEVIDYNPINFLPSNITTLTVAEGSGGDINISNKNSIKLENGGNIGSATFDSGNAGNVDIETKDLFVSGSFADPFNGKSYIYSSGSLINPITAKVFIGIDLHLTGNSGNLVVKADNISLNNGGLLSVKNDGPGNAGSLKINANQVLVQGGDISAATSGGDGGDITLNTNSLVLSDSSITASAKGAGNGGNVEISSTLLAGDSRSLIAANAEQGNGGIIDINTQGLIFHPQNITATSDRGAQFSGTVNVNYATTTFTGKNELAQKLSLAAVPVSCSNGRDTLRVITADALNMPDDRLEAFARANGIPMFVDGDGRKIPLIEVAGWIPNGDGTARTYAVVSIPETSVAFAANCGITSTKS